MSLKKLLGRPRPSPAMAVAVTALVLASVGSAAAVSVNAPAGPAGHLSKHKPKQKKKPACLSSTPSLCSALRQAVDGEINGYLAAHKRTLQGATGVTGPTGPSGQAGAAGAANGYTDQHPHAGEFLTISGLGTVISVLNLPAGTYVVQADVHVQRTGPSAETPVTCKLVGAATLDESTASLGKELSEVAGTDLALSGPLTLSGAGSASVECSAEVGGKAMARATMTAVQVTNLTSTSS